MTTDILSKYRGPIMGVSALWIMFYHLWRNIFSAIPVLGAMEVFVKRIGFCGVDMFFFLSGFGLVYAIQNKTLIGFYIGRAKRIFVPALMIGLSYLALGYYDLKLFLLNISGFHFYTRHVHSFLWFFFAISTFYLFFPLYYRPFAKAKEPGVFLSCSLIVWLIFSIALIGVLRRDLYEFTNRIPVFLVGVYLGHRNKTAPIPLDKGRYIFVGLLLALGLYLSYLTNYKQFFLLVPVSNCCVPNLLISVSVSILLATGLEVLSKHRRTVPVEKILNKSLSFLGIISFELYCIQDKYAYILLSHLIAKGVGPHVSNLLLLIFTVCAAYLLHLLCGLIIRPFCRKPQMQQVS